MSDPLDASEGVGEENAPGLVGYIKERQREAEDGRLVHEERWLKAYKNFRGIYDSTTQYTNTEKSKVFVKITKTKVLAAYGQIVDILFANNQEIKALTNGQKNEKICSIVEIAVVTNGSKGANIFQANDKIFIPPIDGLNVLDTTGAGDLFASGFLFGFSQKMTLFDCGKLATKGASHIIQQYGARPAQNLSKLVII